MVVVLFPGRRQSASQLLILEQFPRQKLVSQLPVEALRVSVLPRAPRSNVQRLDAQTFQPLPNRLGHELRPIVAADRTRHARMANNSARLSITSSLVMFRATLNARHSRMCSSTIDSHFSVVPLVVRSNTKSHIQTWGGASSCRLRSCWTSSSISFKKIETGIGGAPGLHK